MRLYWIAILLNVILSLSSCYRSDCVTISIESSSRDFTTQLREKLEGVEAKNLRIVFDEGIYFAKPDFALDRYCAITNHGNGMKKILFPLADFDSVEIEGNGASIICHGRLFPFLFEKCSNVNISDLTIDWDIPFTFLAEVVAVDAKEGWRDVKPLTDGFSWRLAMGQIRYPNIDGFNYKYLGSTLPFTKDSKRPVVGAIDITSKPKSVKRVNGDRLRIYEKLRYYPPVGSLLSSKGDREDDRYAPAFDFKECNKITLNSVTIHHALGMGFLFERSEDITLKDCRVMLSKGSKRVVSSTADATHFANCKGDILIEDCRFENMLDDGTNVHGTYVVVEQINGERSVIASLQHFEQMGFKFADKGDDVWFIIAPSPDRASTNRVEKVRVINEKYMELIFEQPLPKELKVGDVVENKTWNPRFTMRGCKIQNHRARSVIIKTPLSCVIEYNYFSSMMSAILLRGETMFWFESGAVEDVVIRNNYFKNVADCGTPHAALYITPKLGAAFDSNQIYDKNITFEGNTIDSFTPRIVIADRVDGLTIRANKIIRNREGIAPFPLNPLFEFINCKGVSIEDNIYEGAKPTQILKSDEESLKSLKYENNINISL